jgi:hypothetical protein
MSSWFNYAATLKILVFGLLVGAALPALFAFGVRMGVAGAGIGDHAVPRRRPALTALSWAIFALVLLAVAVGVLFISRDFVAQHTGWISRAPDPRNIGMD